jgi:hypothetical protein
MTLFLAKYLSPFYCRVFFFSKLFSGPSLLLSFAPFSCQTGQLLREKSCQKVTVWILKNIAACLLYRLLVSIRVEVTRKDGDIKPG